MSNPSDSYLQSKIDTLEEKNDTLEQENDKLKNTNENSDFTCDELYDIRVNVGLKAMTMDSMFEAEYFHLIENMPNDSANPLMNELIRLSNEGLTNLDEIKDNQKLQSCDLSDEQRAMILLLDLYERSVGEWSAILNEIIKK